MSLSKYFLLLFVGLSSLSFAAEPGQQKFWNDLRYYVNNGGIVYVIDADNSRRIMFPNDVSATDAGRVVDTTPANLKPVHIEFSNKEAYTIILWDKTDKLDLHAMKLLYDKWAIKK